MVSLLELVLYCLQGIAQGLHFLHSNFECAAFEDWTEVLALRAAVFQVMAPILLVPGCPDSAVGRERLMATIQLMFHVQNRCPGNPTLKAPLETATLVSVLRCSTCNDDLLGIITAHIVERVVRKFIGIERYVLVFWGVLPLLRLEFQWRLDCFHLLGSLNCIFYLLSYEA